MPQEINLFSNTPLSIPSLLLNLGIGAVLALILRWHFRRFGSTLSNRDVSIQKKDRNHDGEVDLITYRYESGGGYRLMDNNYDGLFEEKRTDGISIMRSELTPPLTYRQVKKLHPSR